MCCQACCGLVLRDELNVEDAHSCSLVAEDMSGKQMSALPSKYAVVQIVPYNPTVDAALRGARLAATQESFTRSDLWFEFNLLDKLMYKSKNQHKAAKHFHKMQEVKRSLKLLKALQLAEDVAELNSLSETSSRGMSASANVVLYSSANKLRLPCQQAGVLVMQHILSACRLAIQMLPAVHAGAAQLLAQLGMTYFMPFCLTALSMLARIQVLVSQLLLDCVKAYNSLMPLVVMLPRSGMSSLPPGKQYPDLPQMLSCTWEAGLPSLHSIPFTDHASFTSAAKAFAQQHYAAGPASTGNPQLHTARHAPDPEDMGEKISRSSVLSAPVNRAGVADVHGAAQFENFGEGLPRSSTVTPARPRVISMQSDLGRVVGRSSPPTLSHLQAQVICDAQLDSGVQPEGQAAETKHLAQAPAAVQAQNVQTQSLSTSAGNRQQQVFSTEPQQQKQQQQHLCTAAENHQVETCSTETQQQSSQPVLPEETAHTLHTSAGPAHMDLSSQPESTVTIARPGRHDRTEAQQAASKQELHVRSSARSSELSEAVSASGDLLVFEDRATDSAQQEREMQHPRYQHSLPAVTLGRQMHQVTAPPATSSQTQAALHPRKRPRTQDQLLPAAATRPNPDAAGFTPHRTIPGSYSGNEHGLAADEKQLKEPATTVASAFAATLARRSAASNSSTGSATAAGRKAGPVLPGAAAKLPSWRAGRLQQPQGPAFIRIGEPQPVRKASAGSSSPAVGPALQSAVLPQARLQTARTWATSPSVVTQAGDQKPASDVNPNQSGPVTSLEPETAATHIKAAPTVTAAGLHSTPHTAAVPGALAATTPTVQAAETEQLPQPQPASTPAVTPTPKQLIHPGLLSPGPHSTVSLSTDPQPDLAAGKTALRRHPVSSADPLPNPSGSAPNPSTATQQPSSAAPHPSPAAQLLQAPAQLLSSAVTTASVDGTPVAAAPVGISEMGHASNVGGSRLGSTQQETKASEAPLLLHTLGRRKKKKPRLSKTPEGSGSKAWQELLNLNEGSVAKPVVSEGLPPTAQHAAQVESLPMVQAAKKSSSDVLSMLLGKG